MHLNVRQYIICWPFEGTKIVIRIMGESMLTHSSLSLTPVIFLFFFSVVSEVQRKNVTYIKHINLYYNYFWKSHRFCWFLQPRKWVVKNTKMAVAIGEVGHSTSISCAPHSRNECKRWCGHPKGVSYLD